MLRHLPRQPIRESRNRARSLFRVVTLASLIRRLQKFDLNRAIRVMAPTLIAFTFASVAHAQGTMDFSGAQTLMGTFNTILEILRKAGGWHHGLYLKIDNP